MFTTRTDRAAFTTSQDACNLDLPQHFGNPPNYKHGEKTVPPLTLVKIYR
jgi:hypothetical protein